MDEYGWASAVGRIRVKERELMSRADFMRVAEAQDLDRALAALRDTAYGPYVATVKEPSAFDVALVAALSGVYKYVLEIAPEPVIITAYRARNDFHNLKVRAKSVHLGTPLEPEAFSFMGNLDPDEFDAEVAVGSKASLAKALAVTYNEALVLVESEKGSLAEGLLALKVDSLVDRRYYAWFAAAFKRLGYQGMTGFQRAEVDLLNLRMSMRALRMGLSPTMFREVALPGGDLSPETIVQAYEGGLDGVQAAFNGTPWSSLAASGAALAQKKESLTKWERACDDALMGVARKAKYYSLGPEPVFGYLFGKETEVRNLRVILSGKQSLVSSQEIAERLREPYV